MLTLNPGLLFGDHYQIIKPIGAGGMGAVYLAQDVRHKEFFVALKVLYPGVIKTREARERFRNEIVASYRVSHPNIVRAYEYFDQDELQAYAMEYVDGGDLHTASQKQKLAPSQVLYILKQAASGLAAVHAQGIIHRDLKPENILLTSSGEVKITDFGVARLKGTTTITQDGAMVGTPKYLAPEYVEAGECDHRGDIYALGVIGYELITGSSPFKSDDKLALIMERLKTGIEPLSKAARHCPPALARVIEKAMSVNMLKRYQSAQDLLNDLELVEQGGDPLSAEADGGRGRFQTLIAQAFRPEPAIFGLPGQIQRSQQNWLRRLLSSRLGPAVLAVCLVVCLMASYSLWKFRAWSSAPDLSMLPNGHYKGMVSGLMADAAEYPLRVWRNENGVFVLLGKSYCAVAKVTAAAEFSCGDLKFRITVENMERNSAIGTISELGWNSSGTWNLKEADGDTL